MKSNGISSNNEKHTQITTALNSLLANFQIYYQNLRGVHWNIRGPYFFTLHLKFEELYRQAQEDIDLIAERLLALEQEPLHTFQDYIARASLPVGKSISNDKECVQLIIESILHLMNKEREILEMANDNKDETTHSIIGDMMASQEKNLWMFKAWLREKK